MEKMSRKKALNTVFTVVIIGVFLTFSLLFAMTVTLTPDLSISDSYFDGGEIKTSAFSPYDNACLKNKTFYKLINEYEYRVFNNISDRGVICGSNGFLFNSDTNESGYNYIDDYTGKISLSDEQLDRFHRYIEMRSRAYENFGGKYVLAVIPNAQTVYSELMPSYLGGISDNTLLSQISRYLEDQGFEGFVDLRDDMIEGKLYGQLYNNTENTVNAMGAYVVYSGILEHIGKVSGDNVNVLDSDYFKLQTRITDGKALAKRVGLDSLIKNETIYISNSNDFIYTLVELFGDVETTYTKYEHKENVSDVTLLIECAREWDKVQLMPYFSSSFSRASYRVTHRYSKSAVINSIPDIVVQVIREDELFSILNEGLASSYNEGLEPGQNPYKTTAAADVSSSKVGNNLYCVTGTVEPGADITLFGDGVNPAKATELDGRFFALVKVNDPVVATQICISVKTEGKSFSDISYVFISPNDKAVFGSTFVGANSMLYQGSYNIPSIPNDAAINAFSSKIKEYFDGIKNKNSNAGANMTVLLVPEKVSVYNQGLSDGLADDALELQVKRIVLKRAFEQSGVLMIDGAETLRERLSNAKLYYQTIDRVTDTGSYYLYYEIMTKLSKDHEGCVPHPLDSERYNLVRRRVGAGYLASLLGFNTKTLNESAIMVDVNGNFEIVYDGERDFSKGFVTYNEDQTLPTAVVIRDGNSDKIVEMMADSFSIMYVLEKGETEIPEYILAEGVDNVIVIASEIDINIK